MSESRQLSIVIPAYNTARYLGEAIESILTQGDFTLQVVVVDDGSTDETVSVAQSFGESVTYLYQPNAGIAAALNRGLEAARAGWLAFCAADDRWAQGRLEKQFAAFEANPAPDIVFGHVQNFFSPELGSEITDRYYCPPLPLPGYSLASMLVKRSTFDRVGNFDPQYKIGEFVDWYARARELGLVSALLPDIVLWRRLHGDNLSIKTANRRGDFARILKSAMDRRRAHRASS